MTQLSMDIDEKQYGVTVIKGVNRKRNKDRHPQRLQQVKKKADHKNRKTITLSLW
ncbi:hypothetical protein KAR34_06285 [bacterium]|nr:hypothetical protein [bacterium]